jgi:hypothetical protein
MRLKILALFTLVVDVVVVDAIRYIDGTVGYFLTVQHKEKHSEAKEVSKHYRKRLMELYRKSECREPNSNYEWWA